MKEIHKQHWIQAAHIHHGALHKEMGIPEDHPIPVSSLHEWASKPGKAGARARLALAFHGMEHHHKEHKSTDDLKKTYAEKVKE